MKKEENETEIDESLSWRIPLLIFLIFVPLYYFVLIVSFHMNQTMFDFLYSMTNSVIFFSYLAGVIAIVVFCSDTLWITKPFPPLTSKFNFKRFLLLFLGIIIFTIFFIIFLEVNSFSFNLIKEIFD